MINENWIYLGTAIGAAGAAVYLRDTLRGTTQPNRVTWLLWAVAPLLASAVELNEGVGLRVLPTFMVGFMPLLIFIASLPRLFSLFRKKSADEKRYFEVTPAQRLAVGGMYFGLIAFLVLAMVMSHVDMQR